MPMEDLRFIAAQRLVEDSLLTEERQLVLAANSVIAAQKKEIGTLKKERDGLYETKTMLETNYHASQENLMNCGTKLASKKGWAVVGQVWTGVVCVGVLTAGTAAILNAVR